MRHAHPFPSTYSGQPNVTRIEPATDLCEAGDGLLSQGYDALGAGDPGTARILFRAAAAVCPDLGDAWAALGDSHIEHSPAIAAGAYARSVAIDVGRRDWRLALAGAWLAAGDRRAVDAFGALVAERSDWAAARRGLARALRDAGRDGEAVAEFREAVVLDPHDRDALAELGALLVEGDDALAAAELLQPALRDDPDDAALQAVAGRVWLALQEAGKARVALERSAANDPSDRHGARALLARLESGDPADLTPAYVRALFDRYAERFDRDLVDRLEYRAPELLRQAVDSLADGRSGLRVLDLGCGTGLAGVTFRSLASELAGVDLAPRMVEKARARGVYDRLDVADAVAALRAEADAWDLVVAADVLVYIADLGPLFESAALALRAGGRMAATVERLDGDGFALGPARRYAHAEAHVRDRAAATGLAVTLLEPCSPRRERGQPVQGLLFVLTKV
ncbi:methyltransferase domain-containing protein [Azospirillum sp. RWY-5-1]|uniref:Methyltransferase domain-containing protein n=1 Tax=Azospirillum oleiclasticum TaxID=2735135 RepID=A0ABX2T4B9_9PROT|nr:methyltransferase domain-containing protein [Azospirillum oleiclasticum]NYZ19172.1 methyltransferase domain-containing protein [Azospirillum oleiclasticum]